MNTPVYFSEFFEVSPEAIEAHGAIDISLVTDLPLFIDPFLLFASDREDYRALHDDIISYMMFLKSITLNGSLSDAAISQWFRFREVKHTWLGFTREGNRGRGLGRSFAHSLHEGFRSAFANFGEETVSRGKHLEKLCLLGSGVGRDMISDFTTNLILPFLADYTQRFALAHIPVRLRREVSLRRVRFDHARRLWAPGTYVLPFVNGSHVLLTPRDMLTKDDTWINRNDLIGRFSTISASLSDADLRSQLNEYIARALAAHEEPSRKQRTEAFAAAIARFPAVLDHYISQKERDGDQAKSVSESKISTAQTQFIEAVKELVVRYCAGADATKRYVSSYDEAMDRLRFLKDVIENKGGHRLFYVDGRPVEREADLQLVFRLTWKGTEFDVSREANDGRGPADFKVSRGAYDKTIVEFKLANNSKLERNLQVQAEVYSRASDATHPPIKAILYFSEDQLIRVNRILERLKLDRSPHIVLIDGRSDNKASGSAA